MDGVATSPRGIDSPPDVLWATNGEEVVLPYIPELFDKAEFAAPELREVAGTFNFCDSEVDTVLLWKPFVMMLLLAPRLLLCAGGTRLDIWE